MAQPNQPLFGLVPAGQPLITAPSSQPSATSFLYAIPHATSSPSGKPFSHLAVFLLPGVALPDGTAAAIYLALNPAALASGSEPPSFQFLGGVGPGKESAVFRLSAAASPSTAEGVVIGVAVEDAASVAERIQQLHAEGGGGVQGQGQGQQQQQQQQQQQPQKLLPSSSPISTQVLAQRIIQNAFNFLAGFSGTVGAGGVEVVPLKAFQDWWRKFENKIRSDPTFLEREQD
ncbi:Golgi apyrase [Hypoxylon texense]